MVDKKAKIFPLPLLIWVFFFFQANSDDTWFIMFFLTWKWHTPKYKARITMIGGLRAVDIVVLEVSNFNESIFNRRWMITLDFWKGEKKSIKREKSLVHFSKLAIGMFVQEKIRQIEVIVGRGKNSWNRMFWVQFCFHEFFVKISHICTTLPKTFPYHSFIHLSFLKDGVVQSKAHYRVSWILMQYVLLALYFCIRSPLVKIQWSKYKQSFFT